MSIVIFSYEAITGDLGHDLWFMVSILAQWSPLVSLKRTKPCYVENNQFDFNALINHLYLKPFNSIIKNTNAFDGILTTGSIKGFDEDLKINLEAIVLPNLTDSVFDKKIYDYYPQRSIKLSNIESAGDFQAMTEQISKSAKNQ